MLPSPGLSFLAISIISSHVSGGVGTRSLRYQSSCTFVFVGMPYVLPSHWTDAAGPCEHVVERVLLLGALELAQPAGLGELGRPDRVHVDQIDVLVAGREAPDEQLA